MIYLLYIVACLLLLCPFVVTTDLVHVRLMDDKGNVFKPEARVHPSKFYADVKLDDETLRLNLKKNNNMNSKIPFFILHGDANGNLQIRETVIQTNITLYQDTELHAVFSLVHRKSSNGTLVKFMQGLISKGNKRYHLHSKTPDEPAQKFRRLQPDEDVFTEFHLHVHENQTTRGLSDCAEYSWAGATTPDIGHSSQRPKRQVNRDIFVDVAAIVDYGVYTSWYKRTTNSVHRQQDALNDIYEYYALVFNGVDMLYKSMTRLSFTIHMNLRSIIVCTNATSSYWTEKLRVSNKDWIWDRVDGYALLDNFTAWANTTKILPPYDHLMLFVGYDLTYNNGSSTLAGLAHLACLCNKDGTASSIIEDRGGFECMNTATHEIGHSLSAKHDGDGNNCNTDDGYIMASGVQDFTETNKFNKWVFSNCSVNYFDRFIREKVQTRLGRECLYQTLSTSDQVPNVTSKMPGQLYGVDDQCRQRYGPSSRFCRNKDIGDVSNVCTAMWCKDPLKENQCFQQIPAEGTTCGDKQWCIDGHCVYDDRAPPVPDNCPMGDQPGEISNSMDCSTLIAEYSANCYKHYFRTVCCSSCAAVYRNVTGCEYGDIAKNCLPQHCSDDYNLPVCCRTCGYSNPNPTFKKFLDSTFSKENEEHGQMLGQLYDVDEQCRQIYGSRSRFCRTIDIGNASNVCSRLYCKDPLDETQCISHEAASGTTCGDKQWCIDGDCVSDKSAPSVSDVCIFGDQPGEITNSLNCKELIDNSPSNCYHGSGKLVCCSSCEARYKNVPGCEYGDTVKGCRPADCSVESNLPICCRTCNYNNSKGSEDTPHGNEDPLPGQIHDVDEQCRQLYGPRSSFCWSINIGAVSNVCSSMYCHDPESETICHGQNAGDGTPCGNRKWCIHGQCVHDDSAPSVPDECPLGESSGDVLENMDCSELVADFPANCYRRWIRNTCCLTCLPIYKDAPGCEYGDTAKGCRPVNCLVESNLGMCCRTCNYSVLNATSTIPASGSDLGKLCLLSSQCDDDGAQCQNFRCKSS